MSINFYDLLKLNKNAVTFAVSELYKYPKLAECLEELLALSNAGTPVYPTPTIRALIKAFESKDVSAEMFEEFKSLNEDGRPFYDSTQIFYMRLMIPKLPAALINQLTMKTPKGKLVYPGYAMAAIYNAYTSKTFPAEVLPYLTAVNADGLPIFPPKDIQLIYCMAYSSIPTSDVLKIASTDEYGKPLYNSLQMQTFRCGMQLGYSFEELDDIIGNNENGKSRVTQKRLRQVLNADDFSEAINELKAEKSGKKR